MRTHHERGSHRRTLAGLPLALACTLLLALALGSAPAFAGNQFQLLRTLTLPPEHGGPFSQLRPDSVAVDELSHDTLVADSGTGLVQVFNASGEWVETWNGSNTPTGSFGGRALSVAADDATGRVYVMNSVAGVVDVLEASGEWVETWNGSNTPAGSFAPPTEPCCGIIVPLDVAVNQANGHVLVEDREHGVVDVFEPTGGYLSQMKLIQGEESLESIGPFTDGLAVDEGTGVVLAENNDDFVDEFEESSGKPLPPLTGLEVPPEHRRELSGSVGSPGAGDSNGAMLYAAGSDGGDDVDVFDSTGAYLTQFAPGGMGVSVDRATGDIYVSYDEVNGYFSGENAVVNVFRNTMIPPARVFAPVVEKKGGAIHARLAGGVDPEGLPVKKCYFEYGTSEAYGQSVECAQSSAEIGKGFDLVHVSAELPAPALETAYDYRLAVENANGKNESVTEVLKIPPAVTLGIESPSGLEKHGGTTIATLNGKIDPEGEAVSACRFEYGTVSVAEHSAPCEPAPGSAAEAVQVRAALSGLRGNTRYVYRLAAKNVYGENATGEEAFETPLAVPSLFNEGDACAASELFNTEAILQGSLEPEGLATSWFFEYRKAGSSEPWSMTATGAVEANDKVARDEQTVADLEENTGYECRLTAENEYGLTQGPQGSFTTAAPPVVDSEAFSAVGFSSATLRARIDGFGARDSYRFEYGTSLSYGSSTAEATLANPVHEEVPVNIPVGGLRPSTVYHYRVVVTAQRGGGTAFGADETFTTFPESSAQLPDGRVYEMVSPLEAQGAEVYVPEAGNGPYPTPTTMPFQAAASGEAVAYVGAPAAGGSGSVGAHAGNEYLARRTATGWVAQDLTPPSDASSTYLAFSGDLSTGVLESREGLAAQAPAGGYDDLYTFGEGGYQPLIAAKPPHRSPEEFESAGTVGPRGAGLAFAGASADFGDLLFEANDALSGGADPGRGADDLYEWVGGHLSMVNLLPKGEEAPDATFGAPNESGEPADPPDFSHAISEDGSRVFWTDLNTEVTPEDPAGVTRLFVRQDGASTVQVDAPRGGAGPGGGGRFWTASGDGSRVFFTDADTAGLTAGTVSGSGVNLYEYDVAGGELTDLTEAAHAGVLGVVGASEDGSHVYFVATGALAEGAQEGQPNLYLRQGSETRFIATLSFEDEGTSEYGVGAGSFGDWEPGIGHRTAEVTPDGRSLVFESVRPLTGYDSDNDEGRPLGEVFVYDSEGAGELFCASCDRTGEAPPVSEVEVAGGSVKIKAAAYLPVSWSRTHMPRFVSEDGGRVFFDTFEPLVAADPNNQQDVYEWERGGEGACEEGPGCDYLLSGGTSHAPSYLVDASASGDDVFFVTDARLVAQDDNESEHLYDDRVQGALPSSPLGCEGAECVEALIPLPIFAAPPSSTFAGVGNFPPPLEAPVKTKKPAKKKKKKARRRSSPGGHGRRVAGHAKRAGARRSRKGTRRAGRRRGGRS